MLTSGKKECILSLALLRQPIWIAQLSKRIEYSIEYSGGKREVNSLGSFKTFV